jgi:hypothetical protein
MGGTGTDSSFELHLDRGETPAGGVVVSLQEVLLLGLRARFAGQQGEPGMGTAIRAAVGELLEHLARVEPLTSCSEAASLTRELTSTYGAVTVIQALATIRPPHTEATRQIHSIASYVLERQVAELVDAVAHGLRIQQSDLERRHQLQSLGVDGAAALASVKDCPVVACGARPIYTALPNRHIEPGRRGVLHELACPYCTEVTITCETLQEAVTEWNDDGQWRDAWSKHSPP